MKLVIQIPCFNEESTLAQTIADLPRAVDGFSSVDILVIDDGSEDDTREVARAAGATRIVRHKRNQGLAASFQTGLETALAMGADVIVNTDGDNQYRGEDVRLLVKPVLAGQADIVVGDRQVARNRQFGPAKTALQQLGSRVVSSLAGTVVPDAVSGFRAISRAAALRLLIVSKFSYTTEMLIQAGNKQMHIVSVPIATNPVSRPPRLYRSLPRFIAQQAVTMIRMYAMYRPMRFFFILGGLLSLTGLLPVLRFTYFYLHGDGGGHVQSLVLGGVLLLMGFLLFVTGLLSDLVAQNRKLTEATLERLRALQAREAAARPASRGIRAPAPGEAGDATPR